MQKMPQYNGTAFRALEFDASGAAAFFEKYGKRGSKVSFEDFISCGSTKEAAFFDKPNKNVRIIMEVKNAPDISSLADGIKFRGYEPKELLLNTSSKFTLKDSYEEAGIYYIQLVQQ